MIHLNDKIPKRLQMTASETDALKERLENNKLSNKDIKTLQGLIAFSEWMQARLARSKLTIKRLRQIFGFKSESRKKNKSKPKGDKNGVDSNDEASEPSEESSDPDIPDIEEQSDKEQNTLTEPKWDPNKNHGRLSHTAYTGCPEINVPLEGELLEKGFCPSCAECHTDSKVSSVEPMVLVFLDSLPLVFGNRYCLERVRCNGCKQYFTASPPEAVKGRTKYSASCKTALAINHYYAGMPFIRLEMLQSAQGVPLPDSTQFDLIDQLYRGPVKPIFIALKHCASQGNSLFFDDTKGRILEQIAANKNPENKSDKKSIHTTAILSEYQGKRIYLFQTNTKTAGKELAFLLMSRTSTQTFITMSDASPHNFPTLDEDLMARWIITLCLAHGRRRFFELFGDADEDSRFVIDIIARVYQHEAHCKHNKLTNKQRLDYHQKHSAPLMESLRVWMNNLLLHKHVEPNSQLGEAINYMLKRWYWLTQFLRVEGAALDDNLCEQAIKVAIRYRKNSLFYRTFYGAQVGDAMMSLLHTCAHNKVNPYHYLNTLQEYTSYVQANPDHWLPWCYQQTLTELDQPEPMAINSS